MLMTRALRLRLVAAAILLARLHEAAVTTAVRGAAGAVAALIASQLIPVVIAPGTEHELAGRRRPAQELSELLHRRAKARRTIHIGLRNGGKAGAKRREPRVAHRFDEGLKLGHRGQRRAVHQHRAELDDLGLLADDAMVFIAGGL